MRAMIYTRLSYANVISTAALFLALGGGAYALSGVAHDGLLHGCVSNRTGVLRLVTSSSSCQRRTTHGKHRNPGETAINWNQAGPQGLQGLQGLQGIPGVQGTQGAQGSQGVQGPPGNDSATHIVVRTTSFTGVAGQTAAICNPGERAVGGGVGRSNDSAGPADVVRRSAPVIGTSASWTAASAGDTPTGWVADFDTGGATSAGITIYVVCASP
jgi:hypothetical protein